MFKRIFLFILTNILILLVIGFFASILGIDRYISSSGLDIGSLLIFSAFVGFSGALISLAMSRIIAKWITGVKIINPEKPANSDEKWLLDTVYSIAQRAGLKVMPQVGFYESTEVNAFATGPTRSRALVAVSTALYNQMDKNAINGVLGHEITHITNGDMVTMTLLQGIINTFVIFLSRIVAWMVSRFLSRSSRGSNYFIYFIVSILCQILFGILGSLILFAYSRQREYRADKGSSEITGVTSMISALEALKRIYKSPEKEQPSLSTLKIAGGKRFITLFSTHPDLDDRIARLKGLK